MANYKRAAERHNDRMERIYAEARQLEHERLERGEEPNPSLTSPEDALKYGWVIIGRQVRRDRVESVRALDALRQCAGAPGRGRETGGG